jgi:hypothetical protein
MVEIEEIINARGIKLKGEDRRTRDTKKIYLKRKESGNELVCSMFGIGFSK